MYDRARDATSRRVPSLATPCYLLSFPILKRKDEEGYCWATQILGHTFTPSTSFASSNETQLNQNSKHLTVGKATYLENRQNSCVLLTQSYIIDRISDTKPL